MQVVDQILRKGFAVRDPVAGAGHDEAITKAPERKKSAHEMMRALGVSWG